MRAKQVWVVVMFFVTVFVSTPATEASVILNEIFADPPSGLMGDANRDGVRSGTKDEFIELLNFAAVEIDISNWFLTDNVSTRHVFPSDTVLAPYTFLSVFGGGSPSLQGVNWQVASTGSLGLNNGGDTVTLFNSDSQVIDEVVYGGIGGKDQSINLFPDGIGSDFVLHSTIEEAQGALFSPGTSVASELTLAFLNENEEEPSNNPQEEPIDNPVVPELPALVYFGFGWGSMLLRRYS